MTLEELAAELGALKTKLSVAEQREQERLDEVERLRRHNAKLLAEKKKVKARVRDDDEDADEDDDVDGGADDETPAPKRKTDPGTARIEKRYKDELAKLKKELDDERAARNKAAIEAAVSEALDKAGVAPQYRAAVKALMLSRKVEVAEDGVQIDGKAALDSVAEWTRSDEGRAFVAAPASGGSAATNRAPSGRAQQTPQTTKRRSEMTPAERGAFVRENGADAYNALPK